MLTTHAATAIRPEPDEARDLLRRELLDPDYHQQTLLERIVEWVQDLWSEISTAASGTSPLTTFAGIIVALLALGVVGFLVSRVRRAPTADRDGDRSVLGAAEASATELRTRAGEALAEGRFEDAVGDAFRALAMRMLERRAIEVTVGSTAHELAERMVRRFPTHGERLRGAADLFDAIVYGDHRAARDDAERVLALDEELRHIHPEADVRLTGSGLEVPR